MEEASPGGLVWMQFLFRRNSPEIQPWQSRHLMRNFDFSFHFEKFSASKMPLKRQFETPQAWWKNAVWTCTDFTAFLDSYHKWPPLLDVHKGLSEIQRAVRCSYPNLWHTVTTAKSFSFFFDTGQQCNVGNTGTVPRAKDNRMKTTLQPVTVTHGRHTCVGLSHQ